MAGDMKRKRDIEKDYPKAAFVAKLRRLADAIERDERFVIGVAGERVYVPARAQFNIEHERAGDAEEIEFQIKWRPETGVAPKARKRARARK